VSKALDISKKTPYKEYLLEFMASLMQVCISNKATYMYMYKLTCHVGSQIGGR